MIAERVSRRLFDERLGVLSPPYNSGVWRFKELVHPSIDPKLIVTRTHRGRSEGNAPIYRSNRLAKWVGLKRALLLKHEGENPTGSFKDCGMTVGITEARRQGAKSVTCASTGNTAASLAAYAAQAELKCFVFVPRGAVAYGKMCQMLAHGAKVLEVNGSFDQALDLVRRYVESSDSYLLNSINPWRLEGQKAIIFAMVQLLGWKSPDWVILPGGNLGNASAFGKALREIGGLDLIDRLPKLGIIQAEGANPFYETWMRHSKGLIEVAHPETLASAIRIGRPVNWRKAIRSLNWCGGVVEQVSDQEIMDAKAIIDGCGIGCEPSAAASVAGLKKLLEQGTVDVNEEVVCILTGNILKDIDSTVQYHLSQLKSIHSAHANKPVVIEPTLEDASRILG